MSLPSICVGLFGPRRAGKSTLLKKLLDNESDPTAATVETLVLRFAHAEVHKCNGGSSSSGVPYPYHRSFGNMLLDDDSASAVVDQHETVEDENEILSWRAVSFVDCPGHMGSIPTMLKGIMMSDVVLVLSRPSKEFFSEPPTLEVLAAADLMGKTIIVVQSRIDGTLSHRVLEKHRAQIQVAAHDILHKDVPIVEVQAEGMSGVEEVCRRLVDMVRVTVTETDDMLAPPAALLLVGASRVGPVTEEEVEAAGDATIFVTIYGRLVQGTVSPGDVVEVRPGVTVSVPDPTKRNRVRVVCHPIILRVSSVVQHTCSPAAIAQGGVLVALRAMATVADNGDGRQQQQLVQSVLAGDGGLEGHVLGHVGSLPGVYAALQIKFWLLSKMFDPYDEKMRLVKPIELDQELLLIVGTMSTYGKVREIKELTEEAEEEEDDEDDDDAGGGESSSKGGGANKGKAKAKGKGKGKGQSKAKAKKKKKKNSSRSVMAMVVGGLSPHTCARPGEDILICRRLQRAWHLIGRGQIIAGAATTVSYYDNEQY